MNNKILFSIVIIAMSCITLVTLDTSVALAADARNFNAGKITDNTTFTNAKSMSVAEIQTFLESKLPGCDTNGTQRAGGGSLNMTNRQWIEQNLGISPPYRCLTDYRENPDNGTNNYGKSTTPTGSLSAAEIIAKYATMYSINPQVLIVTLQKENGLITDNIPIPKNYSEAMGFGCPDNRPVGAPACDPTYGSFATQIYQAARHFRGYMDRPAGWYVPYSVGMNTILWSPNGACGTSSVNIENSATAALYSYTPYRPNQAALNAQYGSGDSCSAYGNRNFYMFFTDWFGSTYAPTYSATFDSVQNYVDNSKTTSTPADTLTPDSKTYMILRFKNTGTSTWRNSGTGAVRLAVFNTASSPFCDSTWISCQRPAEMKEASVAPGDFGTFEFWYKAPTVGNDTSYQTKFGLVSETIATMTGTQQVQTTLVQKPRYIANYHSVDNYTDSSKTTSIPATPLVSNQKTFMTLRYKNDGNVIWRNSGVGAVRLATIGNNSPFCDSTWISCQRPAEMKEASVAPGQIASFDFWYTAPNLQNTTNLQTRFGVISETIATMTGTQQVQTTLVQKANYDALYSSVENYTNNTKTIATPATPLASNQKTFMVLKFKNNGNTTWRNSGTGAVRLAVFNTASSPFCDSTWISCQRPAEMKEASVAPGDFGTFEFWYKAPTVGNDTSYQTKFGLVSETIATMTGTQQVQTTLVRP